MGFKHYDETYVERKMTVGNDLRIMCANKYNNFKVNKEELEGYELDVINKAQKSLLNITNLALENAKITDENRKSIIKDAKNIMRAEIMLKHKADDYSGKELEIAVEGSLRAANYDEMLKDASISKVAYHALFRGNNNVIENDNNILYQGRNAIQINEKFEAKKESMKAKQIEQDAKIAEFVAKSDEAIDRMENYTAKTYTKRGDYYKDAALAMTGIIYSQTQKLPKSVAKNKTYSLEEYATMLSKSKAFRDSLKGENGKFLNPSAVIKKFKRENMVKDLVADAADAVKAKAKNNNNVRSRSNSFHVKNKKQHNPENASRNGSMSK
jgi:hypothetical protein